MKDQTLIQVALYAAIIGALGLLPPIPFAFGVPISAQSLGVMLAGVMLGPWRGALAMALFCGVVLLGLPLLSGGRGGLAVLTGPTAGFFVGFPFAAAATGMLALALRPWPLVPALGLATFLGGLGVLYLFGVTGFSLITGTAWPTSLLTLLVFVPGDLVKVALTLALAHSLMKARPGAVATRA